MARRAQRSRLESSASGRAAPWGIVGWREWVGLPALGIETIKAKVDTGARTSALHAFDVETLTVSGKEMVRFEVHPEQRRSEPAVSAVAPLVAWREIKSSAGHAETRPVVLTTVELMGRRWEIELTLTRRDLMGFRMLLGRQALRGGLLVDPARSFLNGKRVRGTRRLKHRGRGA